MLSLSQNEAYSVNEAYSGEKNTQIWVNITSFRKLLRMNSHARSALAEAQRRLVSNIGGTSTTILDTYKGMTALA